MTTTEHPILRLTESYLAEVSAAVALGCGGNYPAISFDLQVMMGCTYWGAHTALGLLAKDIPENRDAAQEALPRLMTLINIVGAHQVREEDPSVLLLALHQAGRWDACLDSSENAYGLASSICHALDFLSEYEEEARPATIAILNDWLGLGYTLYDRPDSAMVAKHLFGDVWCTVASWAIGDDAKTGAISHMIAKERPPFMPGLCRAQTSAPAAPLPELV